MKRLPWLLLLGACGGGAPGDLDGSTGPDAGGTPRERIGWIDVYENLSYYDDGGGPVAYRSSQVLGAFYADHPPSFHRVAMTSGDCELRLYTPSSCDPACTTGLCVETNVCEEFPTLVSAGRLTIDGLATAVSIDPEGGYYYTQSVLPEDLFADDATVTAELAGADLPAMTLTAGGVPEIEAEITDGKITLIPGSDYTLRWTPAGSGRVRVTLNANNQGHGGPFLGILECDVADAAGEVVIPAVLADAFPETQAWTVCAGTDCPPSTIRRYRRDAFDVGDDQEVELMVSSQRTFGVDHVFPD
jgi:hypothetical protein